MDKLSYALGQNIGHQLLEMGLETSLNVEDFASAISDLFSGRNPKLSNEESHLILNRFFTEMEQLQQAEADKRGKAAKEEGERFLAENAKRDGVFCTRSGLQFEILKEGDGPKPVAADTVRCHYEGTLIDGTVFDSSYRRNQPAEFGLRQVIAGWTEGVQMMNVGAKYKFYIPYNLGYGERGAGSSIPPYAALIFTVELLAIV
ncbi:MAG: FKBP-type peptidyl-prolyl cis-trans isomerase [Bacteroidales bacterium]|nr:FKBP-type peptidyl-prolyl cis-trans isomerase [Bacteroidales bacterium]